MPMVGVSIPTLKRSDPIPRQVLERRLKQINKRRAQIEAKLQLAVDYEAQELRSEDGALAAMRRETEEALNPSPKPSRSPALQRLYDEQRKRDVALLKMTIRERTQNSEHHAARQEAAGNFRDARLHRLQIPTIPEEVCREFGKDPSLLAEIEDGD